MLTELFMDYVNNWLSIYVLYMVVEQQRAHYEYLMTSVAHRYKMSFFCRSRRDKL